MTTVEAAGGCAPTRDGCAARSARDTAFFVLSAVSLIPVPHAHVPVGAPDAHAITADVPR